jgi:hypothetical protein
MAEIITQAGQPMAVIFDQPSPLVNALLEAGHHELAEHFRCEEWHPKGCWALDVILGRS